MVKYWFDVTLGFGQVNLIDCFLKVAALFFFFGLSPTRWDVELSIVFYFGLSPIRRAITRRSPSRKKLSP